MVRPVWQVAWSARLLFVFVCWALVWSCSNAEANHRYAVSELCKNHFLQQLHRVVDGATVSSRNERSLNCQLTFQTESILQRFMVRFPYLQLDCNDHLYIHDGAHVIEGKYKAELSCRNTQQSVGTLYMRSNYVTFQYKTDSWGTDKNGFDVVITAFKQINKGVTGDCLGVKCGDLCVSDDLACDGIRHCPGGEDESASAGCSVDAFSTLMGVEQEWAVGVLVGIISVLLVCIAAALFICAWRRRRGNQGAPRDLNNIQMNSLRYNSNGPEHVTDTGKLLHSENWMYPTEWTGTPAHEPISRSRSLRRIKAILAESKTSGSCSWRCLCRVVQRVISHSGASAFKQFCISIQLYVGVCGMF